MNNNEENISRVIHEAWKRAGVDTEAPGLGMSELLELADQNFRESTPIALNNWLLVFDECGAWFANLAILLMFSLIVAPSGDIQLRRVLACVIGNISSQIIAIRKLVLSGLDVQAKQLLRILIENIDVSLLIAQDKDALGDFELTIDELSSNDFWHKHISKGKIRTKIHSKLGEVIGRDAYREFEQYFKQEEQILGMAIHPSLGAAQMACFPRLVGGHESDPFSFGFLGGVSAFSERTLSYAVFYTIFYLSYGYVPKNIEASGYDDAVQKGIDELQDRVDRGKIALGHICGYAFQNKQSAEFSTSMPDHL